MAELQAEVDGIYAQDDPTITEPNVHYELHTQPKASDEIPMDFENPPDADKVHIIREDETDELSIGADGHVVAKEGDLDMPEDVEKKYSGKIEDVAVI